MSSSASPDSGDLEALLQEELDSPRSSPRKEGDGEGEREYADGPSAPQTTHRPLKKIKTSSEQFCPPHPGYMGGICIRCGIEKTKAEQEEKRNRPGGSLSPRSEYFLGLKQDGSKYASERESPKNMMLNYIHHGLEVSKTEMERAKRKTKEQALERRKLLLVLDLDHTLLHSTRMVDVDEEDAIKLHSLLQAQEEQYQTEGTPPVLFHLGHMGMWTKFRPGVREFLENAKKKFDLHVFTMGDKSYAAEMASLLDPTGALFSGRVASSSDADSTMMKDLDVLLGSDDMMVILDDTVGVWPKHKANVIQMKRYLYFPADGKKFGCAGTSYMEVGGDEDPDHGALMCALHVLDQAHEMFFSGGNGAATADIRECLASLRGNVLRGCTIMFTRVIPKDSDQTRHAAWLLATKLGATCVEDCDSSVTHVITGGTTSKSAWGAKHGKHVVSLDWLYACGFSWEKVDEKEFPYAGSGGDAVIARGQVHNARTDEDDAKAALAAAGGGAG